MAFIENLDSKSQKEGFVASLAGRSLVELVAMIGQTDIVFEILSLQREIEKHLNELSTLEELLQGFLREGETVSQFADRYRQTVQKNPERFGFFPEHQVTELEALGTFLGIRQYPAAAITKAGYLWRQMEEPETV